MVFCMCSSYPQSISSTAKVLFESGEVKQALSLADTLLIPTLKAFSVRKCEGDEEVLESVREEWCQCLMHPSLKKGKGVIIPYTSYISRVVYSAERGKS